MKFRWDLSHLYQTKEAWQKEKDGYREKTNKFKETCGEVLDSKEKFKEVMDELYSLLGTGEKLYCYAKRHFDEDNSLSEYEQDATYVLAIYNEVLSCKEKISTIILKQKEKSLEYIKAFPEYKRIINLVIRNEKYQMDSNDYEFINEFDELLSYYKRIYNALTALDLKNPLLEDKEGKLQELTVSNYNQMIIDPDVNVRKKAWFAYNENWAKFKNTLAVLYDNKLTLALKKSKLSHYDSLAQSVLFREELPKEMIDYLIKTTNEHLALAYEYHKFKKTYLRLEEYHIYDTSLSICSIPKMEIEIEDAVIYLKEALSVLGEEYTSYIDQAFVEGWLDIYPRPYKRKMTYSCISYYGVPYAALNYNKSVLSLKDLAHELGHSIHTAFAKKQPFKDFEYSLFMAEITSKVNEILFYEYMINNTEEKEEKIYLVDSMVSTLINTLFGQMLNTEFEDIIIKKKAAKEIITAKVLDDVYQDLYIKYHKEDFSYDKEIKNEWTKVKYFWTNDEYYMFKYVTGLGIASSIAYSILNGDEKIKEGYLNFLTVGNSISIVEALKLVDIDLNNYNYIENAYKLLESKLKYLKELTNC